jgi:hypothetical protein
MQEVGSRLKKSKLLVLIYIIGIVFQAVYVPFSARQSSSLLIASTDAGYSWVWQRPIYYDMENNRNIMLAEVEAWKASKISSETTFEKVSKNWLPESLVTQKPPASWVPIYGIAYVRWIVMLILWTVVTGGLYYIMKRKAQ